VKLLNDRLSVTDLAKFSPPDFFTNPTTHPWRGGLVTSARTSNYPGFQELSDLLKDNGYKTRNPKSFQATYDFTVVNRSINWHKDADIGLIAICLIDSDESLSGANEYTCTGELITRSGSCPMGIGDVVVFDSSRGHAWISGHCCLLATVAVRR
jgi:hypothetical protein